jgi:PAS domain S-box-containing protein
MTDLSGYVLEVLRDGGELVLYRGLQPDNPSQVPQQVLVLAPVGTAPTPATLERLEHEYALASELDPAWAARPLALIRHEQRTMLVLEDPGGDPIDRVLGQSGDLTAILRAAIAVTGALGQVHQRGLIHKDIKPANVLLDAAGRVHLTGFGIASRLPRERQDPGPPEIIAGTLAYMAPEQTGRMNRSIDARSDLYALGVTLYELLTKTLPFAADDPLEWVHCHIARQPTPPSERATDVPTPLSAIVMKLLAKTAEERYQTAAGLAADLRRCLTEWESTGRIDPFTPGAHDASDRLLIPETLYGRKRQIDGLLAAFEQVVDDGTPALALISGPAGIGKSSVVHELHKALVPRHGLFAAGKFDQYQRDHPYTTIARAFHTLIRQILGTGEAELRRWHDALQRALEANGQVIVNLIPALEFVIGPQPRVPDLPAPDGQHRFQAVFQRFLAVFARPEHPLVLFLDDLQWLDAATLALVERLFTEPEVGSLLLVGAYRDNEVGPSHPLVQTLAAVRAAGARVHEVVLAPLRPADVTHLVADALHCGGTRAAPLARLVREKTGGNPFFANQFLTSLAEEGLIAFDPDATAWTWDLARIRARHVTDNVVDLLIGKLARLSVDTQDALWQLACLGSRAPTATLAAAEQTSEEAVHGALWEAVRAGLVFPRDGGYTFLHDRVHEAAYASIPEQTRGARHLLIGRRLAAHLSGARYEEAIFEIANQFNRGAALESDEEREQVANLNLMAGRRARAATAYVSALNYFAAGAALLAEEDWTRRYPLTFALEFHRAGCEFLTGALADADGRLSTLSRRASTLVDRAAVTCLRVVLDTTLDRPDRAIDVGLDYLRDAGIDLPAHPTAEALQQEYARVWQQLGTRPIEALIDLPLMRDPDQLAAMDVLTEIITPAVSTDSYLEGLIVGRMTNLSLEHGNSDASCFAYVNHALMLGAHFGDYDAGFRFGRLALDLVDTRGLDGFKARVFKQFGAHVNPWSQHLRAGRTFVRQAFDAAVTGGDVTFAAYSCNAMISIMLASGDPLADVQRETEHGIAFARRVGLGRVIDILTTQLGLVRTLRGVTPRFGTFDDADLDERRFQQRLDQDRRLILPACWYWIRRLQAAVLAADYASALEAAEKARPSLWVTLPYFEVAEYHFYAALARAASCNLAPADQRLAHVEALATHHHQLEVWARHCPENFDNRAALVGAEIAQLEGRDLDAIRQYDRAIQSSREHGFVQNEALAHELGARFYLAQGLETIGHTYLQGARNCYERWGALGKVKQLDDAYPQLHQARTSSSTATIGTSVGQLDVETVVKASQALSSEIVLSNLVEKLMRFAVEHAGAERGLLILLRSDEPRIEAEATTPHGRTVVTVRQTLLTPSDLPQSALHYVIRTRERVVLGDAMVRNLYSEDDYVRRKRPRSVLCLPIVKQTKLVGALYLENGLTPYAFTSDRVTVLELLASQAAIPLENATLYERIRLDERELRTTIETIPAFVSSTLPDGSVDFVSHSWLDYVGSTRERMLGGGWTSAIHPDDHDRVWSTWQAALARSEPLEVEARFRRADGTYRWFLSRGAPLHDDEGRIVKWYVTAFDIEDRKQAEGSLGQAQAELAHIARVSTLGEMAASIVHEVNQPLSGVVINANACLRFLMNPQPNLDEVRDGLQAIARDGRRAGDVIARIRALARRTAPEKELLDINDVIREVVVLAEGEARRTQTAIRTEFAGQLPRVLGDRVQLQQVILNLVLNGLEAMHGVMGRSRDLVISTHGETVESIHVAVQDAGCGIDPQRATQMFEPFYSTKASGLGMGLSISRSIIGQHGGQLWAVPNDGPGTTFHFVVGGRAVHAHGDR